MKKYLLLSLTILFFYSSYSQPSGFLYGKMVGEDTLVGFFKFDNQFDQNGQRVVYKQDLNSNKRKSFQSRDYLYFESDSLYMEIFDAIPTLTGSIILMVPRTINGKIQLFEYKTTLGGNPFVRNHFFYIKTSDTKFRITRKDFKNQMRAILHEDAALLNRIENGELDHKDLREIVLAFNNGPYGTKETTQ